MKKLNQSGFGIVEFLTIIVLIGALVGVGWYVWQRDQDKKEPAKTKKTTSQNEKTNETKLVVTSGGTADQQAIKKDIKGFYEMWLGKSGKYDTASTTPSFVFSNLIHHVTPKVFDAAGEQLGYNYFLCTQMGQDTLTIGNAQVTSTTIAKIDLKAAYPAYQKQPDEVIGLELVKNTRPVAAGDPVQVWQIDKVTCDHS